MGERRGTKGLELWCRRMTEGYPGVNVTNMTTSWRDGLAFCAIIHHFRPDLIEFSKLNKDDIYHNNELAFRIAERHLGIPALLEPEDMVECSVPDRLSILTYLSQFYQTFVVGQGKSPARLASKRPATSPDHGLVSPASTSPPTKVAFAGAGKVRREPCAKCGLPVFIAERLNVGKLLYHRTCFRCARCSSQLTLANYYETENSDFCCETCPDEESQVLSRSLSDEEKSATLKKSEDEYSTRFETALEFPERSSSLKYSKARSCFINSQVDGLDSDSGHEDEPPDLPKTRPPERAAEDSFGDSGFPSGLKTNVNTEVSVSVGSTSRTLEESHDIVTKDTISAEGDTSSLVKARMRLFESKSDASNETQSVNNQVPLRTSSASVEVGDSEHSFKDSTLDKDSIITISDSSRTNTGEETTSELKVTDDSVITVSDSAEESHSKIEEQETLAREEPNEDEYPDDLNPFGDADDDVKVPLNPFEDDEDDLPPPSPKPAARRKIKPSASSVNMTPLYVERKSVNPFEEQDGEEKAVPQPLQRKLVPAPKISLNPFWSDDEEAATPVPKPRFSKSSSGGQPESISSSASGSSSSQLGLATKKKKAAPKPPMVGGSESGQSSLTSSPCHSVTQSPRGTPKVRKAKKAPLPPTTSTPVGGASARPEALEEDFEQEKSVKDEQNRNRQSQNLTLQSPSSSENSSSLSAPNKSTYGKWKRRKGQAPSRPIPQRRTIKSIPMNEVRQELEIIEIQQQGLEKQGVRLEQIIREKCEAPGVNPDDSLAPEIEDMVLQLFELVNEKNELFRRQAELMYLRRQQKLEEEHADIEYQIRCLMLQPEANKTDSDKAREEELINRLVEIVERRNEIIECLEMDRVREAEEDDSINNQLNLYNLKKEECVERTKEKKEKKKHKKEKKFKLKGAKIDADKDIDESEGSTSSVKDKKKKKFNIF
ncbi:hypothetical protein TcasGA2_TC012205 [Tribolium castaneum]|uniref:MICAL-like protein 1 n=1 Tax=Tribolium castaneum TaxID=7070 RepID=D6X075_TRICA|nr:PREDICTED: MICAL-like protein 1 [Tribolium castaneum]XP_008197394.1 PREDICTED: MICAL-like protein 1 [Tribolium castaneum]EFA10033.2 hypothetical protein TcasGA2_TC012205 [Tribolium castaneum]|eukprot:XP_008197388.1 PREDICTED: MICAL-like protein 1 [Tribolium castaneum]